MSKATMWPRTGSTGGGSGSPPIRPAHAPIALTTAGARNTSLAALTPATAPLSTTSSVTGRPVTIDTPRATAEAASARTRRTLSTHRSPGMYSPPRTPGFTLGSASRTSDGPSARAAESPTMPPPTTTTSPSTRPLLLDLWTYFAILRGQVDTQKARCAECRTDISIPSTYAHGDHVKCATCQTRHKVVRS